MRFSRITTSFLSAGLPKAVIKRIATLAGWSMIAIATEKLASTTAMMLTARTLGAAEFGRFSLTYGLINSAQVFILLGSGPLLSRYIPNAWSAGPSRASSFVNMVLALVASACAVTIAVGAAGGYSLVGQTLGVSQDSNLPQALSVWLIATALSGVMQSTLIALEKGKQLASTALGYGVSTCVIVPLAAAQGGMIAAALSLIVLEMSRATVLLAIYGAAIISRGGKIRSRIRSEDMADLIRFAPPVFLMSALWYPTIWFSQMLVVKHGTTNAMETIGTFSIANTALGAIMVVSTLVNRAALPILSSLREDAPDVDIKKASWSLAIAQGAATLLVGLPIAAMAPWIMSWMGPSYFSGWPVIIIMVANAVVLSTQTALANYLLVAEKPYIALSTMLPWALFILMGAYLFPQHGAYTIAVGMLVANLVRLAALIVAFRAAGLPQLAIRAG